jgi:hypothetical protein
MKKKKHGFSLSFASYIILSLHDYISKSFQVRGLQKYLQDQIKDKRPCVQLIQSFITVVRVRLVPNFGNDSFLPNPVQFIIHPPPYNSTP